MLILGLKGLNHHIRQKLPPLNLKRQAWGCGSLQYNSEEKKVLNYSEQYSSQELKKLQHIQTKVLPCSSEVQN